MNIKPKKKRNEFKRNIPLTVPLPLAAPLPFAAADCWAYTSPVIGLRLTTRCVHDVGVVVVVDDDDDDEEAIGNE